MLKMDKIMASLLTEKSMQRFNEEGFKSVNP